MHRKEPNQRKPEVLRIVHMPDPQLGFLEDFETSLKRLHAAVAIIRSMTPRPDCVILCGDMLHEATRENAALFKEAVRPLEPRLWMVPGNHDIHESDIAGNTRTYRERYGADFFAKNIKGVKLLGANTQALIYGDADAKERQLCFIREELAESRKKQQTVVVAAHHPPFVKDADEADSYFNLPSGLRGELLALFIQSGVRFYLAGHTHIFMEQSYRGMPIFAAETIVENFDKRPRGFRLLSINTASREFTYDFIPV